MLFDAVNSPLRGVGPNLSWHRTGTMQKRVLVHGGDHVAGDQECKSLRINRLESVLRGNESGQRELFHKRILFQSETQRSSPSGTKVDGFWCQC